MPSTPSPPSRIMPEYLLEDWTLPLKRTVHDLMVYNAYEWKLLPKMDSKWRKILLTCTSCTKKSYLQYWPVNWTTLAEHYEKVHRFTLDDMRLKAEMNETEGVEETKTPRRANLVEKLIATSTISRGQSLTQPRKRGPACVVFDRETYMTLLLMMIVSNNLPFSLVDTDSFKRFVLFLREDAPLINRHSLRRRLTEIYEGESKSMKKKFAENTGSFALTIDEWNSSNNIDFLGITLHFYNNDFRLENYTIGFEMLDENLSYTGEVVFEQMMKVLCDYGIEKRIVAITRDNAGPMNVMIKKFTEASRGNHIEFSGDIRCVGHVLNLVTECVLNYTFFKKTATLNFLENVKIIERVSAVDRVKALPDIIRSIITQIRYSHKAKNSFKKEVDMKKQLQGCHRGSEKVVKDNATRWLSTYRMIDQFIYFREEITKVLRFVHSESDEDAHIPEDFQITDIDWQYLQGLRDILELFEAPMMKLQRSSYSTIHHTIPMIDDLLCSFDDMLKTDFVIRNPLISCGITEARSKLLEYYPIQDESIKRLGPLYLAMVLDPRFKLETFRRAGFSDNKVGMIKRHFYVVYFQYSVQYKDAVNTSPQEPTQTSSPVLGRFRFGSQTDVVHSEHEIERYLKEPIENPCQDPVAFHKTRKASFPIISRIARDYFAVLAMSAPAKALFSRMGDVISKKRNKLSPTTIRMLAILKSRGIIREDDIPQDNGDTEDDVDQPIEVTDEQEDAGVEDWLIVDDVEDDEVTVDTSTATQVFKS